MADFLPIMLALCSMLLYIHYVKNYAGIIDTCLFLKYACTVYVYRYCMHMCMYVIIAYASLVTVTHVHTCTYVLCSYMPSTSKHKSAHVPHLVDIKK